MLLRDVQIGAGFHELASMNSDWKGWALGAIVAVVAAVTVFYAVPYDPSDSQDPLEIAGEGWEDWTLWEGRAASDWGVDRMMRFQSGAVTLWFAPGANCPVMDSLDWLPWPGGWLANPSGEQLNWGKGPVEAEMMAVWHPQRHGKTQLFRKAEGYWSTFQAVDLSGNLLPTSATSFGMEVVGAEFPVAWNAWRHGVQQGEIQGLVFAEASRTSGHAPPPQLCGRGDGTHLQLERSNGDFLTVFGWTDSTGMHAQWAERGWKSESLPTSGMDSTWMAIEEDGLYLGRGDWGRLSSVDQLNPVDAWIWSKDGGYQEGNNIGHGRIAWSASPSEAPKVLMNSMAPRPAVQHVVGEVRNHRTGKRMEIHLEGSDLRAMEGGLQVWSIPLDAPLIGKALEVDLYKNGKFQCAFATERGVHLIDVLGREVSGFPLTPSGGIRAWLLADYDRNRSYRFLVATASGSLLNYKEEGAKTPGWRHASTGVAIAHLAHVRVGSKDYIFASHEDESVRLLSRSGQDRSTTSVTFPADQIPAFRKAGSIESSTLLYVDSEGWVQERTFGANEPVGMSRRTKGSQVSMEDVDQDGRLEVVVLDATGNRTVWDQRNEQVQ